MGERSGRCISAGLLAGLARRKEDDAGSREPGATPKVSGYGVRDYGRTGELVRSSVVGLLLFSVVAFSIAEAGTALFCTVILAWALFPLLVGTRDALEAGCVFMLISLGFVVVVSLARYGPGALTP